MNSGWAFTSFHSTLIISLPSSADSSRRDKIFLHEDTSRPALFPSSDKGTVLSSVAIMGDKMSRGINAAIWMVRLFSFPEINVILLMESLSYNGMAVGNESGVCLSSFGRGTTVNQRMPRDTSIKRKIHPRPVTQLRLRHDRFFFISCSGGS